MPHTHPSRPTWMRRPAIATCLALLSLLFAATGSHPTAASPALAPATQPGERYRDPVFAGARPVVESDIVYGRAIDKPTGDEVDLLLDYYDLADDPDPSRAVFVFVHGGGFRGGNKSTGRQYAQQLVQYGFVVLSITYRTSQGDQWGDSMPAAVADARQALRWLHGEADARRLDTDRVFMGGTSAGAITSLMVAYTDVSRDTGEDARPDPVAVAGVVDWWGGLYDHIDDMSAGGPPLMIVHGTEDPTVSFEQATMLKARAEAVGIPLAWYPVEGARHGPHNPTRDVPRLTTFFWEQVFDAEGPPNEPTASPEPPDPTVEPTPRPTDEPTPTRVPTSDGSTLYLPAALRNMDLAGSSSGGGRPPVGTAVPRPTDPPDAQTPTPTPSPIDLADVPMRRARNLRFAEIPGVAANLTSLDVYAPEDAGRGADPYPIVLYVHGGGWSAGDKRNAGQTPNHFVHRGYIYASTNYRLTPDADFPAHAEDVAAAVAFVRERAGNYGGDPARIALIGHSAGAHLVALVGTDPRYLAAHDLSPADLRAVVPNDTQAYDISYLAERSGGSLSATYTRVFGTDPAGWAFASPISYVAPERGIPPMLIAHSGVTAGGRPNRDRPVYAARFRDALHGAGVPAEVLPAPDKTHGQINAALAVPGDPIAEAVLAWLDARMQ